MQYIIMKGVYYISVVLHVNSIHSELASNYYYK